MRHLLAAAALLAPLAGNAADIYVNAGAVDNVTNGNCSVVEAILAANTDAAVDACVPGNQDDTIHLSSHSTYELTAASAAGIGLPQITKNLVIEGNYAAIIRSSATGTPHFPLMRSTAGLLTLSQLTLANGVATSSGTMTQGGGVSTQSGLLTILDSTIVLNACDFDCLGAGVSSGGTLEMRNSLVAYNSAPTANSCGGGVLTGAGNVSKIVNSTIEGNVSGGRGGGICMAGTPLTLIHSTVTGNQAGSGSAIGYYSNAVSPTVINSVLSDPAGGVECDVGGGAVAATSSFVRDASCGSPAAGDPRLAALADNGGGTQTRMPYSGSPLLDAADSSYCAAAPPDGAGDKDQRGQLRPIDGNGDGVAACDIGAAEYVVPPKTSDGGGAFSLPGLAALLLLGLRRARRRA